MPRRFRREGGELPSSTMDALPSVPELMDAVEATPSGSDERLAALKRLAAHPCAWYTILATEVWAEISRP